MTLVYLLTIVKDITKVPFTHRRVGGGMSWDGSSDSYYVNNPWNATVLFQTVSVHVTAEAAVAKCASLPPKAGHVYFIRVEEAT